jgi:hypothetical protein
LEEKLVFNSTGSRGAKGRTVGELPLIRKDEKALWANLELTLKTLKYFPFEYCIVKEPSERTFEPPSVKNKATQCMTRSHPSLAASMTPKKGFYSPLDDFIGKTAFTS